MAGERGANRKLQLAAGMEGSRGTLWALEVIGTHGCGFAALKQKHAHLFVYLCTCAYR